MMATWAAGVIMLVSFVSWAEPQAIEQLMGVADGHCSVAEGTPDGRTFACQVWDHDRAQFARPAKIEIYRDQRRIATIEPGAPIAEWHFWNEGEQIAVHAGDTNLLYETATGKEVAEAGAVARKSDQPAWAKGRAELDDESVPEGPAYVQQRTLWIAKVLRQIEAIRPGMTRRNLESIMTTEGGISTRQRRTYVYKGCPYVKVDAAFAPAGADMEDDRIVSISRPYLQFSVMD